MNYKSLAGALLVSVVMTATAANAATYKYVGSWVLGTGLHWSLHPEVYSGQEAAAALFGGTASQYAISTVNNDANDINFKTWLDGVNDPSTYASHKNPAAQDYSLDIGGGGYGSNSDPKSAYSALVQDHFFGTDTTYTNYAFVLSAVPLPASAPMFGAAVMALGVLGFGLKRKKAVAAA